jgi:glycosyltransferase involved in cell wall biosynthesis
MKLVDIIIPTKNEESNIDKLIQEINDNLAQNIYQYQITVVDDSSDKTKEIAESLGVNVIQGRGLGLAQAVIDGITQTNGDAIVVMDADLQHPPSKLPELFEQLKYHDLVVMTKHTKESMADLSLWRKLLSNLGTWAAHVFIPVPVSDPMTGFFGIRRKCLDGIPYGEYIKLNEEKIEKEKESLSNMYPDEWDSMNDNDKNQWYLENGYANKIIGLEGIGFKIGLELFTKAKWVSHVEIPIQFAKRNAGMSKGSMHSLQKHLWRLFTNSLSYEVELPKGSEEYFNYYEGNDWHRKWKQDIGKIIKEVSKEYNPQKVLNIGCGSSPDTNFFTGNRTGIDINKEALEFIKDYSDAKYQYGSILDIPFVNEEFDMVGCIEVIEHINMEDCKKSLSEISRVLKPDGYLVLATPNYGSVLWNIIEKAQHIVQPKAWTSDHITKFNRNSINKLCYEYSLKEVKYYGVQANMDMVIVYQKVGG